jgi:soluble lytic murein transglycosylase-like protein
MARNRAEPRNRGHEIGRTREARPIPNRVDLLWTQWERDRLSIAQRFILRAIAILRRPARVAVALGLALLLVAMVDSDRGDMSQRVFQLEDALTARKGELELVRIQLAHLDNVMKASSRHQIPADLAQAIYDAARDEGIATDIAFSLVDVESSFTRGAVSSKGAVGLTQVMPSTALILNPSLKSRELFERDTNLRLGFRYLRQMIRQYNGNLDLALLAYNRGPTRVDSILRAGGNPSNGYERSVRRSR